MTRLFQDTYRCDCVLNRQKGEHQVNFSKPYGYFYVTSPDFEFNFGKENAGVLFSSGRKYKITIEELEETNENRPAG